MITVNLDLTKPSVLAIGHQDGELCTIIATTLQNIKLLLIKSSVDIEVYQHKHGYTLIECKNEFLSKFYFNLLKDILIEISKKYTMLELNILEG